MRVADKGIHRHGRAHDLRKAAHLAEIGYAHLDNGSLVPGLNAENGQRYAKLVIEIFLGFKHVVPCGQDRRDHLLGGRFTDGARNSYDGDIKTLTVSFREVFKRLSDIRNNDNAARNAVGNIFRKAAHRAELKGFGDVVVTVGALSPEGCEHRAFFNLSAVYNSAEYLLIRVFFVYEPAACYRRSLPNA